MGQLRDRMEQVSAGAENRFSHTFGDLGYFSH
jgi:hypothetical protein